MKSQATNPVGDATETLLMLAMERIMREQGRDTDRAKLALVLDPDFISEDTENMMGRAFEMLYDYAEGLALEALNLLLYPEED